MTHRHDAWNRAKRSCHVALRCGQIGSLDDHAIAMPATLVHSVDVSSAVHTRQTPQEEDASMSRLACVFRSISYYSRFFGERCMYHQNNTRCTNVALWITTSGGRLIIRCEKCYQRYMRTVEISRQAKIVRELDQEMEDSDE